MGDVEVVVEDIERLNLDDFDPYDPKMEDWRITKEMDWSNLRIKWVLTDAFFLHLSRTCYCQISIVLFHGTFLNSVLRLDVQGFGLEFRNGFSFWCHMLH